MNTHEKLTEVKKLLNELSTDPNLRRFDRARMGVAAYNVNLALENVELVQRHAER